MLVPGILEPSFGKLRPCTTLREILYSISEVPAISSTLDLFFRGCVHTWLFSTTVAPVLTPLVLDRYDSCSSRASRSSIEKLRSCTVLREILNFTSEVPSISSTSYLSSEFAFTHGFSRGVVYHLRPCSDASGPRPSRLLLVSSIRALLRSCVDAWFLESIPTMLTTTLILNHHCFCSSRASQSSVGELRSSTIFREILCPIYINTTGILDRKKALTSRASWTSLENFCSYTALNEVASILGLSQNSPSHTTESDCHIVCSHC